MLNSVALFNLLAVVFAGTVRRIKQQDGVNYSTESKIGEFADANNEVEADVKAHAEADAKVEGKSESEAESEDEAEAEYSMSSLNETEGGKRKRKLTTSKLKANGMKWMENGNGFFTFPHQTSAFIQLFEIMIPIDRSTGVLVPLHRRTKVDMICTYFYGPPLWFFELDPKTKNIKKTTLGLNVAAGEVASTVVPKGNWVAIATKPNTSKADFVYSTTTLIPGTGTAMKDGEVQFAKDDKASLLKEFPAAKEEIEQFSAVPEKNKKDLEPVLGK